MRSLKTFLEPGSNCRDLVMLLLLLYSSEVASVVAISCLAGPWEQVGEFNEKSTAEPDASSFGCLI